MNKKLKYFVIFVGILAALWVTGRVTNMLQWFRASAISNYPTLKPGNLFFASNLIAPKRFSFICYYSITPEFGKQIWVHRLCGLEGDKVEIRNGDLLVNDQYVDSNLSLAHNYILTSEELDRVRDVESHIDESSIQYLQSDTIIVSLPDKFIHDNSINAKRKILSKDYKDEYIRKQFLENWNQDNFGPIQVPRGKYFLLGDNRSNAEDSRYIGLVTKSNYIATVIGR